MVIIVILTIAMQFCCWRLNPKARAAKRKSSNNKQSNSTGSWKGRQPCEEDHLFPSHSGLGLPDIPSKGIWLTDIWPNGHLIDEYLTQRTFHRRTYPGTDKWPDGLNGWTDGRSNWYFADTITIRQRAKPVFIFWHARKMQAGKFQRQGKYR